MLSLHKRLETHLIITVSTLIQESNILVSNQMRLAHCPPPPRHATKVLMRFLKNAGTESYTRGVFLPYSLEALTLPWVAQEPPVPISYCTNKSKT